MNKLCVSLVLVLATFSTCLSQRRADTLYITLKEKLVVRIVEVEILDIKYKALEGDTTALRSITKTKIDKVVYGNGDTEDFKSSPRRSDYASFTGTDKRHYKYLASHPFQREIAQWSEQRLHSEQKRLRDLSTTTAVLGVMTSIAGPTLLITGVTKLFDEEAAGYLGSGIFVATLTIPLAITSGKSRKKVNFIKTELERRKNGGY